MGQLRGFYQINSSISKLAQNICTNGVDKALMKLGEQIKYESNLKGKNHRQQDSDQDSFGKAKAFDKSTGVPNTFVNTDSSNMSSGIQRQRGRSNKMKHDQKRGTQVRSHQKNDRMIEIIDGEQTQEIEQQLGQINYNIENISGHSDGTGKTQSGGSDHELDLQNQQKSKNFRNTGALDDMEDEEDRYQEYKAPDSSVLDKDDLTKDLAMAQVKHNYRDRLYSTSGVIIEGPAIKQKKKSIDHNVNVSKPGKFDE